LRFSLKQLLAVAVLLTAGIAMALILTAHEFTISPAAVVLPADGREHKAALLRAKWAFQIDAGDIQMMSDLTGTMLQQAGRAAELWIRTPVEAGKHSVLLRSRSESTRVPVEFQPDDSEDEFRDGLPDWMPLHSAEDRQAFRAWFTEMAERAAGAGDKLPPEIVDCASLLRYAYRESLLRHDDKWYAQFAAEQMPPLESVTQWSYPHTPLGPGLFRTRTGHYVREQSADGTFSQFADAKTLMTANAFLVSRKVEDARPGDLIFYRQLEQNSEYHSMIITGERGEWVVYHTGPIGTGKGEMRRMQLADLLHHPDARWRPEPGNSNFLGVYRWKILREGS
jgi:uncharacterized protein YfaT (DUF1175 family)